MTSPHPYLSYVVKENKRNRNGVKSSSDLYRTIKGAHYICWMSNSTPELRAAYKQARVRIAMRSGELFIHHMDTDMARKVDERFGLK